MSARLKAWSMLIVLGMGWGLTFSLGRIAAIGGAHAFGITFWQAAIAGALLIAFSLVLRRAIPLSRQLLLLYIAAGLLGMVVPNVIYYLALAHVPAGVLSITLATAPLLTFLTSALAGREVFALGRVTGVCLGTLAIVLLVGPDQSLPDPAQLPWVLLCLLAPFCYAALNVMLDSWVPRGATPFGTTVGMFVAAMLALAPVVYLSGTFEPLGWPLTEVEWAMLGLGFIGGVAFTLYIHLIDSAGAVFSSLTANFVTLFGVIWGIVIFGERNSLWVWLSFATMMVALALVVPRKKPATA